MLRGSVHRRSVGRMDFYLVTKLSDPRTEVCVPRHALSLCRRELADAGPEVSLCARALASRVTTFHLGIAISGRQIGKQYICYSFRVPSLDDGYCRKLL